MAGFRSPLFVLGLGAGAGTTQAGFRGPLPLPPIGGGAGATQAGFIGPIPFLNLGAGEAIVVTPPPGGSMGVPTRFGGGQLDRTAFGDDDEVLMMVIRRFLERVE